MVKRNKRKLFLKNVLFLQAKSFKNTVDSVQKQLREDSASKRSCPDSEQEVSSPSNGWKCQSCQSQNALETSSCKACFKPKSDSSSLPKLSELFRPKAGSWECKACYTVNGMKDSSCVSCDSPKDKSKSPGSASPAAVTTTPVTVSATGMSLSEMFKPKAGSWECAGCLVRNDAEKTVCPACATPKPGHENDTKELQKSSTPFSFGLKPSESATFSFGINSTTSENKGTGFSFGIKLSTDVPKSSFTFETKQVETAPVTSEVQVPSNSFTYKSESTEKSNVSTGFTFTPRTQVTTSSADSTSSAVEKTSTFKFGNLKDSSVFEAPTPPNSSTSE